METMLFKANKVGEFKMHESKTHSQCMVPSFFECLFDVLFLCISQLTWNGMENIILLDFLIESSEIILKSCKSSILLFS